MGRHRQRQLGQGGQESGSVEAATQQFLLHICQGLGTGQELLGLDRYLSGEVGFDIHVEYLLNALLGLPGPCDGLRNIGRFLGTMSAWYSLFGSVCAALTSTWCFYFYQMSWVDTYLRSRLNLRVILQLTMSESHNE